MTSILDAVIQTIRNSLNKKDAKENLISLYSFLLKNKLKQLLCYNYTD